MGPTSFNERKLRIKVGFAEEKKKVFVQAKVSQTKVKKVQPQFDVRVESVCEANSDENRD